MADATLTLRRRLQFHNYWYRQIATNLNGDLYKTVDFPTEYPAQRILSMHLEAGPTATPASGIELFVPNMIIQFSGNTLMGWTADVWGKFNNQYYSAQWVFGRESAVVIDTLKNENFVIYCPETDAHGSPTVDYHLTIISEDVITG